MFIHLVLIAFCLQNVVVNASAANSASASSSSGSAASASSSSANMEVVKEKQDLGICGIAKKVDVQRVSFSPDGKHLAVIIPQVLHPYKRLGVSEYVPTQMLNLFEVKQESGYLELKKALETSPAIPTPITWSGNGHYLAYIGPANFMKVLDLRTGEEYRHVLPRGIADFNDRISLRFSSDSKWLLYYHFAQERRSFIQKTSIFTIENKDIVRKKFTDLIKLPSRAIPTEANLTLSPTMDIFIINYPDLSTEPPYNTIGAEVFRLMNITIKKAAQRKPFAQPFAQLKGPVKDVQFSPDGKKVAFAREVLAKHEFWVEIDTINQETGLLTTEARMLCGKKIPLMVWARDSSFFAYSSDTGIHLVLFNKKKQYFQTLDIPVLESLAVSPDGRWLLAYGWDKAPTSKSERSDLLRVFAIDKNQNEAPLQSKQQISGRKVIYAGRSALTFSPTMNLFVINYTNHLGIRVLDFNDTTGAIRLVKQGQPLASIATRVQSALPSHMKEVSSILDEYIAGEKPLKVKTETESAAGPSTATGMFGNDSLIRAIQLRNFTHALAIAQKMTDEQIVLKNDEDGKSALDLMLSLKSSLKESEKKAYDDLLHFLRVKEDDANRDQANATKKAGEKRKR